jgi:hypothetical protein
MPRAAKDTRLSRIRCMLPARGWNCHGPKALSGRMRVEGGQARGPLLQEARQG